MTLKRQKGSFDDCMLTSSMCDKLQMPSGVDLKPLNNNITLFFYVKTLTSRTFPSQVPVVGPQINHPDLKHWLKRVKFSRSTGSDKSK